MDTDFIFPVFVLPVVLLILFIIACMCVCRRIRQRKHDDHRAWVGRRGRRRRHSLETHLQRAAELRADCDFRRRLSDGGDGGHRYVTRVPSFVQPEDTITPGPRPELRSNSIAVVMAPEVNLYSCGPSQVPLTQCFIRPIYCQRPAPAEPPAYEEIFGEPRAPPPPYEEVDLTNMSTTHV